MDSFGKRLCLTYLESDSEQAKKDGHKVQGKTVTQKEPEHTLI